MEEPYHQVALSAKKTATGELPKKGANIVNMSQGTSPLAKDKGPTTETGKAVGIKRLQSDSPGFHNVYVRRKVESEHSKVNPSQDLKGNGRDKAKEQETHQDVQQDQQEEANRTQVASPVAESVEIVSSKSPEKPNVEIVPEIKAPEKPNVEIVQETKSPEKPNVDIVPEKTEPPVASGTGIQEDAKQLSIQYWNERFNRLQAYLESCDHSTHEGYLRSKKFVDTFVTFRIPPRRILIPSHYFQSLGHFRQLGEACMRLSWRKGQYTS